MSQTTAHVVEHTPVVAFPPNGHVRRLAEDLKQLLAACRAEGIELTPGDAARLLAADRELQAACER